MAVPQLTTEHVATIAAAISSEPDDELISWTKICDIGKRVTGKSFTRQTLHTHQRIRDAYSDRIAAFRKRRRTKRKEVIRTGDPKDRRIRALEEEVEELKNKLNAYDVRFILILENTKRLGFQREDLIRPLPATGGSL